MVTWLSVSAIATVVFLSWVLYRRAASSKLDALTNKRRATSRLVSLGELVDGNRHMKVALALTSTDLFYENIDIKASLDLRWIREVEYDSTLATGHSVQGGKVLRIRCFSQVFEFIIPKDDLVRWHMMLPPRGRDAAPDVSLSAVAPA